VATLNGQNGEHAEILNIGTGELTINGLHQPRVVEVPPQDYSIAQCADFSADQIGLYKAIDLGTGEEAIKCRPAAGSNTRVGDQQPKILAATVRLGYEARSPLPEPGTRMPVTVYVKLRDDKSPFVNMDYKAFLGDCADSESPQPLLATGSATYAIVRSKTSADPAGKPRYISIPKDCDKNFLGESNPDYSIERRKPKAE
jgi:hypothetical protein